MQSQFSDVFRNIQSLHCVPKRSLGLYVVSAYLWHTWIDLDNFWKKCYWESNQSVGEDISGTTRAIFTKFLCMMPMFVARSSFGMLTIGRIACRQEGGDRSAERGRSVICDCLVQSCYLQLMLLLLYDSLNLAVSGVLWRSGERKLWVALQ